MSNGHKYISVLGATGSIGDSTLDLVRQHPEKFTVKVLTAHRSAKELAALANEFRPEVIAIADPSCLAVLRDHLRYGPEVLAGEEAIIDAATVPVDLCVSAIVGAAGLRPTLAAVRQGIEVALANKECLVCAGDLMTAEVKKHGATLLPVDSEHNAIFQVFDFDRPERVDKIILTASGGPFRTRDVASLSSVTPAEAVAHPNWDMGAKISVDSATMMNKGLEMIEAYHLFPVETSQIDVIIHPQSIIHSMVDYVDGSVLAQLGSPDMRIPISYCLDYPDRLTTSCERLDLAKIGSMEFYAPDLQRFPCLKLAMDAMRVGGAAPAILNAANEVAVAAFLEQKIKFTDISGLVHDTLDKMDMKAPHSIANLLAIDSESRHKTSDLINQLS